MSKCLRSFLKIKHFSVHADIFQFMPIILDILDLRNFLVDNIHLVYLCKRKKNKQCMIQKLQGVCKKKLLFFLIISQDHKFIAGLVWAFVVMTGLSSPTQTDWESHILPQISGKFLWCFVFFLLSSSIL